MLLHREQGDETPAYKIDGSQTSHDPKCTGGRMMRYTHVPLMLACK
jgi:hypothetical protein